MSGPHGPVGPFDHQLSSGPSSSTGSPSSLQVRSAVDIRPHLLVSAEHGRVQQFQWQPEAVAEQLKTPPQALRTAVVVK